MERILTPVGWRLRGDRNATHLPLKSHPRGVKGVSSCLSLGIEVGAVVGGGIA